MKKFLSLSLIVLLCMGMLTGCGGGGTANNGDNAAAIKVGGTGPLTGGAAIYGNAVKQAAEKWGISERRVQILCKENRIPGVSKIGYMWLIPKSAVKPFDKRIKRSVDNE